LLLNLIFIFRQANQNSNQIENELNQKLIKRDETIQNQKIEIEQLKIKIQSFFFIFN